jgi:hypothetical protein
MAKINRNTRTRQILFVAAAAAALAPLPFTTISRAATVTWNNATPPGLWSNAASWTGGAGVPVAADSVIFGATGSAATNGTLTNEVDADFTIGTIQFANHAEVTGGHPTAEFHTTQIDAGRTLSVTGTGNSVFVGTNTGVDNTTEVYSTFTGAGTLNINNTGATIMIRQGVTGNVILNGTQRATWDLGGLANFTANVSALRVGLGTSSAGTETGIVLPAL